MDHDALVNALENIRQYAADARNRRLEIMDVDDHGSRAIEARLAATVSELQQRLNQRHAELEKVGNRVIKLSFPASDQS